MNLNTKTLAELVVAMKKTRAFDTDAYLSKKREAINKFFHNNRLNAAVVGLSGGVDSAVTLMLLLSASDMYGSPIKKVVAVIAPIHNDGVTGQDEATQKAKNLVKKFSFVPQLEAVYCPLKNAAKEIIDNSYPLTYVNGEEKVGFCHLMNSWVTGQMDSVLRTPVFYMQAARLQDDGYKSLVVGTTNRDEGSYIGFFGKASDGMVDLQPIADIHKSEVYKLAVELGVTQEIIGDEPKGDVWDGRVDEEMIGAPYWFLEMYLNFKMQSNITIEDTLAGLNPGELERFKKYAFAIEKLHTINAHKYKVGSPAHFIDIMPRTVPGGWK